MNETIEHVGRLWKVYSKKKINGRRKLLGTHPTKEKAVKQLQAIEASAANESRAMSFSQFLKESVKIEEKRKTASSPDWHDSDAPDAKGRFKTLGVRALAAWLIRTRGGDMRKITGSLNQQIVFNRNDNPSYARKMESVREEVKRQLNRKNKK